MKCKVLSIDAVRHIGSWEWNSWYSAGEIEIDIDGSNRSILKAMRKEDFLGDDSKGKITVKDDEYNIMILNKNTLEPIFAIEYGSTNITCDDNMMII